MKQLPDRGQFPRFPPASPTPHWIERGFARASDRGLPALVEVLHVPPRAQKVPDPSRRFAGLDPEIALLVHQT